jgi:hypothetical protein
MVRWAKSSENGGVRPVRLALAIALSAVLVGCGTHVIGGPGQTAGTGLGGTSGALREKFQIIPTRNQLDLLFVIDDSAGAAPQQKLLAQVPTLIQALEQLPDGLPDLHVGVISTDMGAGPQPPPGCTATGKAGQLQNAPRGTCADTTLSAGATFVSADAGLRNFTSPLEDVVQCIAGLGSDGCWVKQPLAAMARALGADGDPPPAANQSFLRSAAALGVLILSTRDDCSQALANTDLFKTDSSASGLSDPLGPLDYYRCNRYGHLCDDAAGSMLTKMPPLTPPATPDGMAASVQLANCVSNDLPGARLASVNDIVAGVRRLKDDPDGKIFVSAIVGPAAPYGIAWSPAGAANPANPGELWPAVMLSCGAPGDPALNPATTNFSPDGTQGEPAVRIARFAQAFQHGLSTSVCNPSYASVMTAIAQGLGTATRGLRCTGARVPLDAQGQPACTVVASYLDPMKTPLQVPIPTCTSADQAPCWRALDEDAAVCPPGGRPIQITPDPSFQDAVGLIYDVSCAVCGTNPAVDGCR